MRQQQGISELSGNVSKMQSVEPTEPAVISSRIVTKLTSLAQAVRATDVRIGLGYTAVTLTDNQLGVAYTFREEARGGCSVFNGLRPISDRPASQLLDLLESSDPIEAGVGLACANALANRSGGGFLNGNFLQHLDLRRTDHVGMVGHFRPLVNTLKERAGSLTVFERIREPHSELRPAEEAKDILPHCQVALISATSIINHTIDGILQLAGGCREVAVLGASTPLLPEVFSSANVTLLSGVVMKEAADVLRVVSEGGGMRQFSPYVRKVSLRVANSRTSEERKYDKRE
jgi:uncharacterized protein (DUF4213/DUF364 family)